MKLFKVNIVKKMILIISIFFVLFFSSLSKINAANFAYKDFDWDKFAEENADYWTDQCEDDEGKCVEKTLKSQKKFYKKLYKLLAKAQRSGAFLDDTLILATVLFEVSPDMFTDDGKEYQDVTKSDGLPYNSDGSDGDDFEIDEDENVAYADLGGVDFFKQEKDTLKILVKAMTGYGVTCLGYRDPEIKIETHEQFNPETNTTEIISEEKKYCPSGVLINNDTKCEVQVANMGSIGLGEKLKLKFKDFFGYESTKEEECAEAVQNYDCTNPKVVYSKKLVKDEEKYWDYLENTPFFDKRAHLQYLYADILKKSGYENMTELNNNASAAEAYKDEIIKVRKLIIDNIKEILEDYRGDKKIDVRLSTSGLSKKYWWPIGSDETNEVDGVLFADGDPSSNTIIKNYSKVDATANYGIDIAGQNNITNVIAVANGNVTEVYNNCAEGDKECGGGYGNYVIIAHNDGNYTLYGFLSASSIIVSTGDKVTQGQVIGKVGKTGIAIDASLHFEVRTDESQTSTVNPAEYINSSEPRVVSAGGDFVEFIKLVEGSGPSNGDNYVVYCNAADVPTVGAGVTLTFQYPKFAKYGVNLSPPFSNYCGTTIPKDVVDAVKMDVIVEYSANVNSYLASNGISLAQYQIDALTSTYYNCGNINGFAEAYYAYGETESLCTNWYHYYKVEGEYKAGLINRRTRECNLFLTGNYGA